MPKRQAFYSFHFANDVWRASQVRNMGVIDGNAPISDNAWEEVKRKGDANIEKWIDEQLKFRSCVIVLVGRDTSERKWVKHEIVQGWKLGKGVVGICIHNLKNKDGYQSTKGKNPFASFNFGNQTFDKIVKLYDPPYMNSTDVYANIKNNIERWVEEAITIRGRY